MTRTERQKEGVQKWIDFGGRASLIYPTGFGKTRVCGLIINRLVKNNYDAQVLISVPTEVLKNQWIENLEKWNLVENCRVEIINTIIKKQWEVDLLVIDECHRSCSESFRNIFSCVSYNYILCVTGTIERLDGKEEYIKKYAPIADKISIEEAVENEWVSVYKDYKVLIDVDLTEYNELNRKFNAYFSYFNYDYNLAMKLALNKNGIRFQYAKKLGLNHKEVSAMCYDWMRCMRERKAFISSHPKKIELAHKILEARQDKKCITFSGTVKEAEKLKYGKVLSSKQTKSKNKITIDEFNDLEKGTIHAIKALDEGVNLVGLSVGIILTGDSSKIRKRQRLGRILRMEENKTAEMFSLVIKNTVEETWFSNSTNYNYITINESQLDDILNGKEINTRERNNITDTKYRF